ncbi:MAG: hypothetical protein P8Y71_30180 [Pseudolabrys sp.]
MGNYLPREHPISAKSAMSFSKLRAGIAFNLKRPFAVLAFRFRERKAWRRVIPRRWLSSGELLIRDLDYTANNELELLRQVDDRRYRVRLDELFGEMNQDRKLMEDRGFLKKKA